LDLSKEAERRARLLDGQEAADSRLDLTLKVLLIGVSGAWAGDGSSLHCSHHRIAHVSVMSQIVMTAVSGVGRMK
jgi:hypothetical protein